MKKLLILLLLLTTSVFADTVYPSEGGLPHYSHLLFGSDMAGGNCVDVSTNAESVTAYHCVWNDDGWYEFGHYNNDSNMLYWSGSLLKRGNSNYTISAWVYLTNSTSYCSVLQTYRYGFGYVPQMGISIRGDISPNQTNSRQIHYNYYHDTIVNPVLSTWMDKWEHIVVTYDFINQTKEIYTNGILAKTDTSVDYPENSSWRAWFIGNMMDSTANCIQNKCFLGRINYVRIWDIPFTSNDVFNLYWKEKGVH